MRHSYSYFYSYLYLISLLFCPLSSLASINKNLLATNNLAQNNTIKDKTPVSLIGEKFFLKKSLSYHFSRKELISFHDNSNTKSGEVFLIGLKPGVLKYNEHKTQKALLILSEKQYRFLKLTKDYIFKAPHLNLIFEDEKLSVTGTLFDELELNHLISICKSTPYAKVSLKLKQRKNSHINYKDFLLKNYNLRIEEKNKTFKSISHNHPLHFCFSNETKFIKDYKITLVLAEDAKINSLTNGLGIQTALDWTFNPNFNISNFSGSAAFLKIKNKLEQSLNFSSTLNSNSPISFSDGTEVQVIDQQGVFHSRSSWKKAESNIKLSLTNETDFKIELKIDLNQKIRTGDAGVFKTNNFSKLSKIQTNKWVKILSFKKNNSYLSKKKTLSSTFLGSKTKEQAHSSYSLWVKAED